MREVYWVKRGRQVLGPYELPKMRAIIRSGELAREQSVSVDEGRTWVPASSLRLLWEQEQGLIVTVSEAETLRTKPTPIGDPVVSPQERLNENETAANEFGRRAFVLPWIRPPAAEGSGKLGIAAFCCSIVWATQIEIAYSIVPVAFLFLIASVTGLVLSVVGILKPPRGWATAGMILGIVGSLLGIVTCIGWLVTSDPRERWIDDTIKVSLVDLKLAERDFSIALKKYRASSGDDEQEEWLGQLTQGMMILSRTHAQYLSASSRTHRFRRALNYLENLRLAYDNFREAIKIKQELEPQAVFDKRGENPAVLRELLDILSLYQTQQISLDNAQAKFRGM